MFGSKILTRFLLRRFFSGFGLIMLVVGGIIMAVTFVERLPSNPTASAAIMDAWVRLMEYVPMFLPLAVFMGTLFASYNLTKSSESIIVSSAGLSPYQAGKPFFVGAAIIGVLATTIVNPYSVRLNEGKLTSNHLKLVDNMIWLRESSDNGYITLRAKHMKKSNNDLNFNKVTIYIQDKNFKLSERIEAENVLLSDAGLSTNKAQIWDSKAKQTTKDWSIKTLITPKTVLDRYLQPDQISFWDLPEFIQKMKTIGAPVRGHIVQFWTLLFLPLTMVSMAVLGIAFSQTKQRRNYSFGIKFALGIITCFAVYFLTNLFNALGATGTLPALLAIIAPPLIIIAGAGTFMASFDNI